MVIFFRIENKEFLLHNIWNENVGKRATIILIHPELVDVNLTELELKLLYVDSLTKLAIFSLNKRIAEVHFNMQAYELK